MLEAGSSSGLVESLPQAHNVSAIAEATNLKIFLFILTPNKFKINITRVYMLIAFGDVKKRKRESFDPRLHYEVRFLMVRAVSLALFISK